MNPWKKKLKWFSNHFWLPPQLSCFTLTLHNNFNISKMSHWAFLMLTCFWKCWKSDFAASFYLFFYFTLTYSRRYAAPISCRMLLHIHQYSKVFDVKNLRQTCQLLNTIAVGQNKYRIWIMSYYYIFIFSLLYLVYVMFREHYFK